AGGQRRRPVPRPRLPGTPHRTGAPRRALHQVGGADVLPPGGGAVSRALQRFRRVYGASPLHLLALIASLAITAAAVVRWFDVAASDTARIVIWFAVAIIAHDLVLLPLYSALDRVGRGGRGGRRAARPTPAPP